MLCPVICTSCVIDIIGKGSSQQPITPQQDSQTPHTAAPPRTGQHVAFDLTPGPAPSNTNTLTPNHRDSPWLNSPSDRHTDTLNPFLSASVQTPSAPSPENFTYVFQSPLTLSRPPGSVTWARTSHTNQPPSPTIPHHNHGCSPPRAGPHSTRSWSPLSGPADHRHRKIVKDLDPFFEDDQSGYRQACKLCQ